MEKIIITTEESCNLNKTWLERYNIKKIGFHYMIDGVEHFSDSTTIEPNNFYRIMRAGSDVKTSQINLIEAKEFLEEYYKQGYKVLHIGFSSGLSGTVNNFKTAVSELNDEYKSTGATGVVVDSLCGSIGQGLLVVEVAKKLESGCSFEELVKYAEEMKWNINHIFTIDDFKYLLRTGRIKKSTAIIAGVLHIKPVLHVDKEGRLSPIGKVFGRNLAIKNMVDRMSTNYNPKYKDIFICQADCEDDATKLSKLVEEKFGVKPNIIPLTQVVGAHGGPGSLALFYVGNGRI